ALVMGLLLVAEPRERWALRIAAQRERPRPRAMRNALQPVEMRAAGLLERRDELTQLRVHRPAVVTLVVVFRENLPVRGDVVHEPAADAQVGERIARNACRDLAELLAEGVRRRATRTRDVHEHKTAPLLDRHRAQRESR